MSELVIVPTTSIPTIISADKDDILNKLFKELADYEPNGSSEAGRKRCTSMAHKVSTAKMDLIRLAGTLTEDHKKVIKAVAEEVKVIEAKMNGLRDTYLAPVEAWKKIEQDRIAAHQSALDDIRSGGVFDDGNTTSAQIQARLEYLIHLPPREWQEFGVIAAKAIQGEIMRLHEMADRVKQREEAAAELERLRAEKAERDRIEREQRIAAQAREDAEKRAKADLERQAREAADREAAIKVEADLQRREVETKHRLEMEYALQQQRDAERRAHQASLDERAKVEAERLAAETEQRRRESDVAHRRTVNSAARDSLLKLGLNNDQAVKVIQAIIKGNVAHVTITY